ncbi:uncharacterized protein LOC132591782 [Zootoca vivipara]|uniref:uncharacterized protein LOC132591782 n=1 Tax=Zootoca vivipara TaxID=8524 RepID=UPI00293BA8A7|nr:uncharacterized protein LOC132591782 [Zootoca vivipara]
MAPENASPSSPEDVAPPPGIGGTFVRGHRRSASCGSAYPMALPSDSGLPSDCRIIRVLHTGSYFHTVLPVTSLFFKTTLFCYNPAAYKFYEINSQSDPVQKLPRGTLWAKAEKPVSSLSFLSLSLSPCAIAACPLQVTSQDKAPVVIGKALEKHNQDRVLAPNYELVQLLPEGRELAFPTTANVFYTMSSTCLDFMLRPKRPREKPPPPPPPPKPTAPKGVEISATFPKIKATGRKIARALF